MKPIEIDKKYKEIETELNNKLEEQRKLYENGERNVEKFEGELINVEQYISFNIFDDTIDMIKDEIKKVEEVFKEHKDDIGVYLDTYNNVFGEYQGKIFFKVRWYTIKDEVTKYMIETKVKSWLAKKIEYRAKELNLNIPSYFRVDCNFVNLFKDGIIDFDALVKIVIGNCKI